MLQRFIPAAGDYAKVQAITTRLDQNVDKCCPGTGMIYENDLYIAAGNANRIVAVDLGRGRFEVRTIAGTGTGGKLIARLSHLARHKLCQHDPSALRARRNIDLAWPTERLWGFLQGEVDCSCLCRKFGWTKIGVKLLGPDEPSN